MLNGVFRNPTTIYFGKSAEENISRGILEHSRNILLVYGKRSFTESNLSQQIYGILKQSEINFFELGGVKSNPTSDLVLAGIDICRQKNIGFVLAIGGGSVIDTAKAISVGAANEDDVLDFFTKKKSPAKSLPLGVILTLPGTGSESNDSSVITDVNTGAKLDVGTPLMFPKFAVLNPELSMTAPKYYRACGVVDAISHIFERYFSNTTYVECSDQICEGLLRTLLKYGPLMMADPQNYDVSSEIMWACKLAHDNTAGFGRKQDWACHKICHEIASRYDVAHGASLAVVFPAWMTFLSKTDEKKFDQFAERVFGLQPRQTSTWGQAIEKYKQFLQAMGMPLTLREIGFKNKEDFVSIARGCSSSTQSGTIGNFRRLSEQDIISILDICF